MSRRELRKVAKQSKDSNQAKYKQLQEEFNRYKANNEMKIEVVNEAREENRRLRSALTAIAHDTIEWGESAIRSHRKLKFIAQAALEGKK